MSAWLARSRGSERSEPGLVAASGGRESRFVFSLAAGNTRWPDDQDFHWPLLLQVAAVENALMVLRDVSRCAKPRSIPMEAEWHMACLALATELRMRTLERRLEESLAALAAAAIPAILLKGAALASTVYGSFVARPMNDVDLLVDGRDVNAARKIMLDAGWVRDSSLPGDDAYAGHHHLPPLIDARGSGLRLELHTSLLPSGNPFVGTGAGRALLADVRETAIGSTPAFVLKPSVYAVHAAVHFVWSHEMQAGAWHAFRDLTTLARAGRLDWSEFVDVAISWRAASCAYWALRLGQVLSNLPVPPEVLERLRVRLPETVLKRLEKHFVQILLRDAISCPSVRLSRALWTLAIRPRQSGHGDVRPWLVSAELRSQRRLLDPVVETRGGFRQVGHALRWSWDLARTV